MQALKSLFNKKFKEKNPQDDSKFDHTKISTSDDISQCPFMKNKQQDKKTDEKSDEKCPYKGNKDQKQKNKVNNQAQSSQNDQQIPRGGCPFMGGSTKKRNPDLFQTSQGFDQPFVSKFNYYLSANKIDFSSLKKNKMPVSKSRQIFNTYPIYLKHTLFYNGQDYKKVRQIQCCSRFMPYQKLREKGNKYFNKGKFNDALDFYERALSLFKWLQYYEQDDKNTMRNDSLSFIESNQSIDSQSGEINSKVQINLNQSSEELGDKDQKLDQITTKYKEFFVIYNDSNVKLCDGEQMEEIPDIDMRRSLMLQLYLNMAAAYMKLNNFSLALQCIQDSFNLSQKVSQIYLKKSQILISNSGCTLQDAIEAKKCAQTAIQMKKTQKIYQSNQNILKMVNLHNADQAYNNTLNLVNQKIQQKENQVKQIKQRLYERLKQINQNEQRIIKQGKTPFQRNNQKMIDSKEFKILLRMKDKYIKVIEFYTQAKNQQQINLAKKQLQQLLNVFSQMNIILNVRLQEQNNQLGGLNTQKIQNRIQSVKKTYCQDIYNAGRFNFKVMQWAIKQIVKEETQQEQFKKKAQQQQKRRNGQQIIPQKQDKYNFLKKASWGLVLIPIAGILINNFLLI